MGITKQQPERRWQNGYGYPLNKQPLIAKAIKKYGWENITHNILHQNLTYDDAQNLEKYYIEKNHLTNPNYGYNCTSGGDAPAYKVGRPVIYNNHIYKSLKDFCNTFSLSTRTVGSWLTEGVPMDPNYYDRGLRYVDQDREIIRGKRSFKRKVICDGVIYDSLRDFCRQHNINSGISHWLSGNKGMPIYWYNKGLRYLDQDFNEIKQAKKDANNKWM